ncbi:MAG: hypothetical protein VX996_03495, partial [Candidatus Thermoplasmatota archaeon]|nr:hypothetical protein [Candidatus Thermoplasmatota archaeon]
MSDDHSARAGSLNAHLTSVKMEIDDDDEDVIQVVVDVVNESSIPVGGLQAALVDAKGKRFEAVEGISSIGPGLTRQFKFEARIHAGTWTFEFNGGGQAMKLGPYEADFEYQADKGRVLGNAIGSSLFSGAFDNHLGDFRNTEERGIIDASSVVMTSYVGENMEGGATKVMRGDAVEEDAPRTPPWATSEPTPLTPLEAPTSPAAEAPAAAADPLLAPLTPASPEPAEEPASTPPAVPSTPATSPPSVPSAPPTPPPSGPPS